jgi:hypothetical protein
MKFALIFFMLSFASTASALIDPRCSVHAPHRSASVLRDFDRATGRVGGWPGHIRDHICPLACGGTDSVANLQWQSLAEARKKDRFERTPLGFELFCNAQIAP